MLFSSVFKVQNGTSAFLQYVAAISVYLGAMAMGMAIGWTSQVELNINDGTYSFEITPSDFSWIGSVVPLGAAFSSIPCGLSVDWIGRKKTLLLISIPFVVGWIYIVWPAAVEMLIVGRFITGFCGGFFCVASPIYISEIADVEIRGLLNSFFQLFLCIGIELAYILGAYVPIFWFTIICAIMPIIFAICFFFMPETPHYLISRGRLDDARKSLQWFRASDYNPEKDLDELKLAVEKSIQNKISFLDMFRDDLVRKGIFILLGLVALQQFCGINAVVFYSSSILEASGSKLSPEISTILMGGIMTVCVLPVLLAIERAGRRKCLLFSSFGMVVFVTILGFYFYYIKELASQNWLPLATLILYYISFSVGAGPIPWVMGAELFAPEVRGFACGVGATVNWIIAFLVTKFYSSVAELLGAYTTFWIFAACCFLGILHVVYFVPETKGKTVDEILNDMKERNDSKL